MLNNKKISVVIPCLNEAEGVQNVLRRMPVFVDEVVVADNGSTDGTPDVAVRLGARVVHQPQRGYGAAYLAGIPAATGDIIVTLDGDASYPPEEIGRMIAPILAGKADFVSGCRFPLKDPVAMSRLNRMGNALLTLAAGIVCGLWVRDSMSGMWAFRKMLVPKWGLRDASMAFSQEIKLRAARTGLRFIEIPITYSPRIGMVKLLRFRDGILCLRGLLKVRFDRA